MREKLAQIGCLLATIGVPAGFLLMVIGTDANNVSVQGAGVLTFGITVLIGVWAEENEG